MKKFMVRKPALMLAVVVIVCFGVGTLRAQSGARQAAIPLPPMGWSSWNSFSNTVDAQVVMAQAKAMVSTGMAKAGYQYINIDEGWWLGERDKDGNIVVDPKAWPAMTAGEKPGDMANIVRSIHGLGLKAGIYTDAGYDGCSTSGPDIGPSYPHTGSEGHYEQDFLQFAKWGFDYVKVDWCGGYGENLDPAVQYAEIARAIARAEAITGHRLYYSICNWGKDSPWSWAPNVGGVDADIWRTSGDIVAPIVANSKNSGRKASFKGMLSNFDQGIHPEAQHTGFYNDPDMMVLGMAGLSDAENRVHMGLWAISGAPLLVGADLTKLSDATLAMLTNPAVLAVDQDGLGLQAVKVTETAPGLQVWSKPLSKAGERAVILLNRSTSSAPIAVRFSDLGLKDSAPAGVKNLWASKDAQGDSTPFNSSYANFVPAGDAVMLLIQGVEADRTMYTGVKTAPGQTLSFTHVASRARIARIQIAYTNPDKKPRFAEPRVNGQIATRIAFPSTGSGNSTEIVTIQSLLDKTGPNNTLSFSTPGNPVPEIKSISLE